MKENEERERERKRENVREKCEKKRMRSGSGTSLFIALLLSDCPCEIQLITKIPWLNYSITLLFYNYLPKMKIEIFPLLSFSHGAEDWFRLHLLSLGGGRRFVERKEGD